MKKTDPVPDWTGHTLAKRIHMCRGMLYLHDYLTDSENDKVKARMVKRDMLPPDAILVGRDGRPLESKP